MVDEDVFLRSSFLINGESFQGLAELERMPLKKWVKLVEIYNVVAKEKERAIKEAQGR